MEQTTYKISDTPVSKAPLNPEHILQIGFGFWASKVLLSAIKFQLFTLLAEQSSLSAFAIREKLNLHERGYLDFLDVLVSLNFLERKGIGREAIYSNTAETELFLDKRKPTYIGGILEMSNNRLYSYWGSLEEGLVTGMPQNEIKQNPKGNQFAQLYADPARMKEFLQAMAGIQIGAFISFAAQFDFHNYKTVCDAGGALGALSVQIAKQNPNIKCMTCDLPQVAPLATAYIKEQGMSEKVEVLSGDFFESIPAADVIVMGNILHDWSDPEKVKLMINAYKSLPDGGAFVCIENIIDDDRRKNTFGLLMSLNMLIETREGRDFTFAEFTGWAKKAGFSRFEFLPLTGPTGAAIAYK
jgi:2-polyprenyl-3-methyl-5-hydroxy-6-metoxy-1,4-benzoquinol methylase